ncbi:MAG: hypothetical protein ACR2G3_11835 [Solirubrobacterales bacterium]
MSTRKTRTLLATLATAVAVAVVPASSHALKAQSTGDRALDDYCSKAAALIDRALSESNLALINGDDAESAAWDRLAIDMIRGAQARGCTFISGRRVTRLLWEYPRVGSRQTTSEPSVGTSPDRSSGGSTTTSPDSGAPPVRRSMAS